MGCMQNERDSFVGGSSFLRGKGLKPDDRCHGHDKIHYNEADERGYCDEEGHHKDEQTFAEKTPDLKRKKS